MPPSSSPSVLPLQPKNPSPPQMWIWMMVGGGWLQRKGEGGRGKEEG
ncbi:unnamed protein product [Prunus armeniaca]|uniref:Uncharacterized protein n=1 Tax=Prunus armeniaca TaxID=36596 RepID=A0A6J5Y4C3_PRUAR|nr:unnamed protein product [Prunus armeniaca]